MSDAAAANLITAEWLAIALSCLILSSRVQLTSLRTLAIAGLVLAASAQISCVTFEPTGTTALTCFYGLRIVAGLGEGMLLCAANASLIHLSDPARAYAIATLVAALLAAAFLAAVPALQAKWPPAGFALLAGIALIAATTLRTLPALNRLKAPAALPRTSAAPSATNGAAPAANQVSPAANHAAPAATPTASHVAPARLGLTAIFTFSVALGALWSFSEVIGTRLGLSRPQADHVLALNLLAGLAGGAGVAVLNDRWGYAVPAVVSITCLAVAAVALGVTLRIPIYVATQVGYGFAYPVALSFLMATLARMDRTGRLLGASGGVTLLGFAIGPSLGGWVVTALGVPSLGICVGIGLLLSVACLIAAMTSQRAVTSAA